MQLDNNIDLMQMIQDSKKEQDVAPVEVSENLKNSAMLDSAKKETVSPLESMMRNPPQMGMSVTKEEIEKGSHTAPLQAPMANERAQDIKKKFEEFDGYIKNTQYLVKVKEIVSEEDYITAVDEVSSLNTDDPEHPYFDFKKEIESTDETGALMYTTVQDTERKPIFFAIRTKEDVKPVSDQKDDTSDTDSDDNKDEEETKRKHMIAQVIIDKTGLGGDVFFTQEERQKLTESDEIRLKEVREVNLSSITVKKVTESFQDHVRSQEFSNSRITICFPASGFSAHMNGLTYGELGDASLSMEGITTSQFNKRLSIIYNKMTNISTGPFESYEDFLKHFAFTDIYMALYGLLVATFPENSSIQLVCGNRDKCGKNYDWHYATRSLLDLDSCDEVFLSKMREIVSASPADYDTIKKNAAVNNCKRIELPKSKIIFEMGILSAYEYLYNFVPILNNETLQKEFGDRVNEMFINDFTTLSVVRKVYVPDSDGSYIEYDNYKDIMDIIFSVDPEESIILRSVMQKLISAYTPYFFIKNTECPYCHTKTERVNVTMDDMLFQTLQRLASTTVDVSNMLSL